MPPTVENTVLQDGVMPSESSAPLCPADYKVTIVRGASAIAGHETEIHELCSRTGQSANPLLRVGFFLGRVMLLPGNRPVVLLLYSSDRLQGAIYLFEKTLCGMPTGYLRCFDHLTGESSVIAEEPIRAPLLAIALQKLFAYSRARVAWATVCQGVPKLETQLPQGSGPWRVEVNSLCREHRLTLGATFAETLSRFGSHTRRNLRYYRRRSERELQTTFHPRLTLEESELALKQLHKPSFQPSPLSMAEWLKMDRLLRTQPGYFAMGLQTNGMWISYLAGLRANNSTYVLLQINHNQFARYSLSTVLRSHFFEHEIELGQGKIKFVNGTCEFFQRCCEPDVCVTVSVRRGLIAYLLFTWVAPRHSAPDHALNMERWAPVPRAPVP